MVKLKLLFITAFSPSTSKCCKSFDGTCVTGLNHLHFPLVFIAGLSHGQRHLVRLPRVRPAQQDPVRLQETSYINVRRATIHFRKACYLLQQKHLLKCFSRGFLAHVSLHLFFPPFLL